MEIFTYLFGPLSRPLKAESTDLKNILCHLKLVSLWTLMATTTLLVTCLLNVKAYLDPKYLENGTIFVRIFDIFWVV